MKLLFEEPEIQVILLSGDDVVCDSICTVDLCCDVTAIHTGVDDDTEEDVL